MHEAAHRPQAGLLGEPAYPAVPAKAAALMHSIAANHALVDGNERLALLATVVFLRINGYGLDLTDDDAFELTVSVAAGLVGCYSPSFSASRCRAPVTGTATSPTCQGRAP